MAAVAISWRPINTPFLVSGTPPKALSALLGAGDPASRNDAWEAFLATYSPLILRAARSLQGDIDDRMDRYAFAIEQLAQDDYRRLRGFVADGRAQFTTWLVLVVRRLCLDELRRRNGRSQSTSEAARERHAMRQRLAALVGNDTELESVPEHAADPHDALRITELHDALDRAVSSLGARDRLMLRLRFEDNESVPTIARVLNAPNVGYVYRRIDALLAELRHKLVAAGVNDPRP